MAGFPYQDPTFLLSSIFLPNTSVKMSNLFEEGEMSTSSFPYYPSETLQEFPVVTIHENYNTTMPLPSDHEPTVTETNKTDCLMAVEVEVGNQVFDKETPSEKKRKERDGSCLSSAQSQVRREKISGRMKLLQGLVPGCDKVFGRLICWMNN
ncbi:hypothetical protein GIB67_002926 [Kingdonia uniflora]|uniref:Uncharacterized protein n=1 Tax=Kingdonia uniflora TaxID=39325 RepID=A0A7J7MIH9_9MAGN|nr:hypothetical protein GIB67_002926 [Kingdonia uniflora]